jgi:Protein O-mannosyl-transferase TMEM260-like
MLLRDRLQISLFVAAVALTRLVCRSHILYDLDSVDFGLALRRFDPTTYQPHPPGYFLYVMLGRAVNLLVHDANLALVLISVAASCGVILLIYRMALEWFGSGEARAAAVIYLVSPLAWFHGTVALTYALESFFSALLGLLCWRIVRGRTWLIVPSALTLGISAGVRPSSLALLGPLFLFALYRVSRRQQLAAFAALAGTLTAWVAPMLRASGGASAYFGALFSLWQRVPSRDSVFNSSPATSVARAFTIVLIAALCFGSALIAPVGARRLAAPNDRAKLIFTAFWTLPSLAFFTFIFLKFVNSGYLLLLVPPGCLWLGAWAWRRYTVTPWPRGWKWAAAGLCIAVNVLIFLASPFYCSYRSMRRFEAELASIDYALPAAGLPGDTLIVAFDAHFLGYRHAGYYLPGYLTLQYPAVRLPQGMRIFAMQGGDTTLLPHLPRAGYTRFVLFPLPGDESAYQTYLGTILKQLPRQDLTTFQAGGHTFVTGPIADLAALFP